LFCEILGQSRQSYYQYLNRARNDSLAEEIVINLSLKHRKQQSKLSCRKIYELIKPDLQQANIKMGRDKVISILQSRGLGVKRKCRKIKTTDSRNTKHYYSNILKDISNVKPNEVWVSDITYLRTHKGFVYLALITDLATRYIVGYHVSEHLRTEICSQALKQAIATSNGKTAQIHHSDRGSQYGSDEYTTLLSQLNIRVSMTKGGSPSQNAVAERINGILKQEYAISDKNQSIVQCKKAVKEAIYLYNNCRPHNTLKMRMPAEVYWGDNTNFVMSQNIYKSKKNNEI